MPEEIDVNAPQKLKAIDVSQNIDINTVLSSKAQVLSANDTIKVEDAAHNRDMEKSDQKQRHILEILVFGGILAIAIFCLIMRSLHADQDTKFYDTAISSIITALLAYFAGKSGKK